MRRREFIGLMAASVACPFAAMAQQAGRTYRLGFLVLGARERDDPLDVAFIEELRRLGFVEGQNLKVEFRTYGGVHVDLISQYAAELVKARLDVITVAGDPAIRAIQQATKTIPIVAATDDMLGSGFVKSVARPGGKQRASISSITRLTANDRTS